MVASRSTNIRPTRRKDRQRGRLGPTEAFSGAAFSGEGGVPLGLSGSSRLAAACVWLVLIAIGVAGRLLQPAYNVTPLAAIGLAAATLFGRVGAGGLLGGRLGPVVALGVPAVALAIGNLLLPAAERSYGGFMMAAAVFAATLWPALLGLASSSIRRGRPMAWIGAALSHSLVFFILTNATYWWLFDDYPHTFAGLGTCFVMALPFFRWMPAGDVAWSLGLLAMVWAVASWRSSSVLAASPLRALRP